jgi:hypothetical protein
MWADGMDRRGFAAGDGRTAGLTQGVEIAHARQIFNRNRALSVS